jgi:hypothetical protein
MSNGLAITTTDSRPARARRWLLEHGELMAFWCLAALNVAPVWAFTYLPTQDGPAHLENAQILRDYGSSTVGYEQVFELRGEPLPNLTSHVLLAGMMYALPALVAEKLLVSLYILGFAGAYRFFLGVFGPGCRPLAWLGLLFVYNRCLWMGFYNYCLSLIPLWIVLGLCLRWRGRLDPVRAVALMMLFTLAYFTHLLGFLVAAAGALLIALVVPPRRWLAPALVGAAALPAACLTLDYLVHTGFLESPAAMNVVHGPLARVVGAKGIDFGRELAALDAEIFAHHTRSTLLALVLHVYFALLSGIGWYSRRGWQDADPGWLFPALFSLLLLAGFVLVPDGLGSAHGGFLKMRLAPLPLLVWLACLREPAALQPRLLIRGATVILLAVNLWLVAGTIDAGNAELADYTAGSDALGRGHRFFAIRNQPQPPLRVDHLAHAQHYYSLDTGNMCLDNYEADRAHFPVKYRADVRGRGHWLDGGHADLADTVICWEAGFRRPGWQEIFSQGPLRIYRRSKQP